MPDSLRGLCFTLALTRFTHALLTLYYCYYIEVIPGRFGGQRVTVSWI